MPYKNIEDRRAWAAKNRHRQKQYSQRWLNSEKGRQYVSKQKEARRKQSEIKKEIKKSIRKMYLEANAEALKQQRQSKSNRWRKKKRAEAIELMGGCCSWCGIDDHDVLEFDHIVAVYRRTNGVTTRSDTWAEVLKARDPHDYFQLLCGNCHTKKTRLFNEYKNPVKYDEANAVEMEVRDDPQIHFTF